VQAIPVARTDAVTQGNVQMISFKVKPQNHERISRWSKRFFVLVFLAGAAMLGLSGVESYRHANSILADHTIVTVPVELVQINQERGRKGRKKNTYHFGYAFEAGGRQHTGHFTTSESNAEPYLDDGATVEVAYANADPSRFDRLKRVQGQSGFGGLLMRLLVAVLGAAFIAFVLHMLLVAKLIVPRVPQAEATPAG